MSNSLKINLLPPYNHHNMRFRRFVSRVVGRAQNAYHAVDMRLLDWAQTKPMYIRVPFALILIPIWVFDPISGIFAPIYPLPLRDIDLRQQ